ILAWSGAMTAAPVAPGVALALVSHTNAGKTTLARTLLGRDVGEVRDLPHVTDLAEAHTLLALPDGTTLQLWDTPGFGNSAKLMQRLRLVDNPIGWLLREVWDRWRDRPFWCSQQAVRAARDAADVVLYLANAAEDPRDAGYLAPEMQVLRWIGKPVIVLLNQVGPPRAPQLEQEDLERWQRHLEPYGVVAEVLALDAFARCWVHEGVLLEAVGRVLPAERREAFARLAAEWTAQSLAKFDAAMTLLAAHLAGAALDHEPVPEVSVSTLQRLLQSVGVGRERAEAARDAAMAALAARLDARLVEVTDRLIRLHGLDGAATRTVLERMREHFATPGRVGEGRAAIWGSVVTGALTGLKADIAAGGLTLGAGLLVGGLLGGLAGAGVARGLNRISGADEPVVWWSDEFLEGLVRSAVLRYLAVAHFGRGRGKWVEGEAPPYWKAEVATVVERQRPRLQGAWAAARAAMAGPAPERIEQTPLAHELQDVLGQASAEVLERLYPRRLPAGLAARRE
ncbi:MAG: GTPase domain-containing protein, partial [Rubrivivax sp.]